jgi:poly(3-hydroxybutyrate) depolymerase
MSTRATVARLMNQALVDVNFVTGVCGANMSDEHRRARLCCARLYETQAAAISTGYGFPDSDPPPRPVPVLKAFGVKP